MKKHDESGDVMRGKKWPFIFLVLVLGVFLAAGCGRTERVNADVSGTPVEVVKVSRRDLVNNLEIASEFQPFQEIEVYAKVSGYIQKLYVDWGTHVKEGQPLADLEIPELEQQLQEDQ